MSMSVRELKETSTWIEINQHLEQTPVHKRILPLLLLTTYLNNPTIKSRHDLYQKSGEYERDLDHFYVQVKYSEHVHKPESDLIRCCFQLHKILTTLQLTPAQVFPLLDYFKSPQRGMWTK